METIARHTKLSVRREVMGGRQYLVAPVSMLPEGVLNGSQGALFYPREEGERSTDSWNHVPIVVYHPTDSHGRAISARQPEVLNTQGIGLILGSEHDGKLRAEAWIDEERVKVVDPRVYRSLLRNEPIEVSTGLYTENEKARQGAEYKGRPYDYVARNYRPDHLAILPDQVGACSVNDGCGMLVNKCGDDSYDDGSKPEETLVTLMGEDGEDKTTTECSCKGTCEKCEAEATHNQLVSVCNALHQPKSLVSGRWKPLHAGTGKGIVHEAAQAGAHITYDDDVNLGRSVMEELSSDLAVQYPSRVTDPAKWDKAKAAANLTQQEGESYWATVCGIYTKMGGQFLQVVSEETDSIENANPEGCNQHKPCGTGVGGKEETTLAQDKAAKGKERAQKARSEHLQAIAKVEGSEKHLNSVKKEHEKAKAEAKNDPHPYTQQLVKSTADAVSKAESRLKIDKDRASKTQSNYRKFGGNRPENNQRYNTMNRQQCLQLLTANRANVTAGDKALLSQLSTPQLLTLVRNELTFKAATKGFRDGNNLYVFNAKAGLFQKKGKAAEESEEEMPEEEDETAENSGRDSQGHGWNNDAERAAAAARMTEDDDWDEETAENVNYGLGETTGVSDVVRGTASVGQSPAGKTGGKKSMTKNSTQSEQEWLNNAPPRIQRAFKVAERIGNEERRRLIHKLTANVKDDAKKKQLIERYSSKSVETLQEMLDGMVANQATPVANETTNDTGLAPLFIGDYSPTYNQRSDEYSEKTEDVLPPSLAINWNEFGKQTG